MTVKNATAVRLAEILQTKRLENPIGNALLESAARGDLRMDALQRLVGTEAQAHRAELAAYGTMLARYPEHPAADLFIQLAQLVYAAQPKLRECAKALGMSDAHSSRWPAERATYSFNGTLSWLAVQGSQAACALASYTDMKVYFSGCTQFAQRVRTDGIDVPPEFLAYYDDEGSEELRQLALDVVQNGLDRGDDEADAVFCARLLEESIGEFWQSAAGTI
ncbi:hypothetical protein R2B67_00115 [Streptomyces cyaneofuscatus]|uniref:hypothetical protein n=1 Tax=Streptomyces cyaneofuscatus TaxID=66883 RepID=UPI002952ED9C|nr:hypothetical protein [Streptomyces cyaneofuscatus]WOP07035.1 hypothetical protein R2B67_00115 [Streptomyces cyaneofuscatus]